MLKATIGRSSDNWSSRGIGMRSPDQREQAAMTPRRDAEPGEAAGDREHQAFGEHLAHQPSASGAERRAHADLALARGAARQQQVRHVDAGHQQHEHHRADQREQRRPDLPDHLFL